MQVGDLVRVYNFTEKARLKLASMPSTQAYKMGLIVLESTLGRDWKVQLLQHPEVREFYPETRLEVASASR